MNVNDMSLQSRFDTSLFMELPKVQLNRDLPNSYPSSIHSNMEHMKVENPNGSVRADL